MQRKMLQKGASKRMASSVQHTQPVRKPTAVVVRVRSNRTSSSEISEERAQGLALGFGHGESERARSPVPAALPTAAEGGQQPGSMTGLFGFVSALGGRRDRSASPQSSSTSHQLGNRLLNVGPNAAPAAVAAALIEKRDSAIHSAARAQPGLVELGNGRPLPPLAAYGSSAEEAKSATWSGSSSATSTGNGMGGSGGNGNGKSNGAMISVSELDTMLQGLRSSLASIQESRAQYIHLLADRDKSISALETQLAKQAEEIDRLQRASPGKVASGRGSPSREAEEAQSRLAQAEERAARLEAEAAARMSEAEARIQEAEARAAEAEAREADMAARTEAIQTMINQQAADLAEARELADSLAAAQAAQEAASKAAEQEAYEQQMAEAQAAMAARAAAAAAPPSRPAAAPARPATTEIVLYYRSSWKQAYVHCNMDNKGWTAVPGLPMEPAGDGFKILRMPCTRAEFVINNGRGEWDSNNNQNYNVTSAGSYRLEHGQLHRTQ